MLIIYVCCLGFLRVNCLLLWFSSWCLFIALVFVRVNVYCFGFPRGVYLLLWFLFVLFIALVFSVVFIYCFGFPRTDYLLVINNDCLVYAWWWSTVSKYL